MVATLCWYDSFFGPYHPQTLCLMAQVAFAYWQVGEPDHARPMLERAVKDLGRFLGREDGIRLRAIATLRDLLVAQTTTNEPEHSKMSSSNARYRA